MISCGSAIILDPPTALGNQDDLTDRRAAFQRLMCVGNLFEGIAPALQHPQPSLGRLTEQPGQVRLQVLPCQEWQQRESLQGLVPGEQLLHVGAIEAEASERAEDEFSARSQGIEASFREGAADELVDDVGPTAA